MIRLKKILQEGKAREYGFDLTEISAQYWIKILKSVGLNPNSVKKAADGGWEWSNDKITIVTANNPITGKYYNGFRQDEKDYASYIGLEGDEQTVLEVAKMIKKYANYIKGEEPRVRGYI